MSDGFEHKEASEQWAWVAGFAAIAVSGDLFAGAAAGAGCLAGIFLTPDLDVGYFARILAMKEAKKEFPVLGRIWHILWIPYAAAIPHRSPLSHWPVIGTAGRMAYLLLIFLLLATAVVGPDRAVTTLDMMMRYSLTHWFSVGLCVSDSIHWLMDKGI